MNQYKQRIVILGAGFAGVQALKEIGDLPDTEIVVIDKESSQTFQPLLYAVATGSVSPEDIVSPVREFIKGRKNVRFLKTEVTTVDTSNKNITLQSGETITFDYLVLTCGGESNFFGMTDVAEHSFGLKNTTEALEVRNAVLESLEKASAETDAETRRKLLTFIVVGGGPTGVEVVGGLAELLFTRLEKFYPRISKDEIKIYILEGEKYLLPPVSPNEQKKTKKWLEKMGVTVCLETRLSGYDGHVATLQDGTTIEAETLVWGAGVRASELLDATGLEQGSCKRLVVRPTLQVKGADYVFAAGDTAHIETVAGQRALPMTAAVAVQSGAVVGRNVRHICLQEKLEDFRYNDKGTLCVVGCGKAVGNVKGMALSGLLCWMAWAGIHIILPFSPHVRWSLFWKFMWNTCRNVQPYRNIYEWLPEHEPHRK